MWFLALFLFAGALQAEVPSPEEYFGYRMGEDRHLVSWSGVLEYFLRLDAASDSVRVDRIGQTTEGRPMIVAIISDPGNIERLDHYRELVQKLADPRLIDGADAEALVQEGKPVVAITCSIHSTEVASTMTAVQFAHDLITRDTPRNRLILENTVLLLMPSLNPDGIDKVRDWYSRWVGGPFEGAPMSTLYHRYAGHDINRDWYILTQRETQLVVEGVYNRWRPQVVLDVHEMSPRGARMFVPPWVDPIDPNIDPLIVQQTNAFGTAIAVDLTAAGKRGVLVNGIYDYFSPARHYQSYHGALRILSESAAARFASPLTITPSELDTGGRNYSAVRSSWNFLEPWKGGEWRLADILGYQLVAFESVLYTAASRRTDLLRNFRKIGQRVISRGEGRAFLIPQAQHDRHSAVRLLRTLQRGDVEIERVLQDAEVGDVQVRAGDHVVRLSQPYGGYANTLLETSEYPGSQAYPGGPPVTPYDATAHSLPLLMGVDVMPLDGAAELDLTLAETVAQPSGHLPEVPDVSFSANQGLAWLAAHLLLAEGVPVHRRLSDGAFLVRADSASRVHLERIAGEHGVAFEASEAVAADHPPLEMPRVGLYSGHVPIIDAGWTRWLLERYSVPHSLVGNADLASELSESFDVLILPDAEPATLEEGFGHEDHAAAAEIPPEFRGGIGDDGVAGLERFVEAGGTLIAFNRAAGYAANRLGLPVENSVRGLGRREFFGPGTLVNVEADLSHPLCAGMRRREAAWFERGPVFRVGRQPDSGVRAALTFPTGRVLASGWLLGEARLAGRAAVLDVQVGSGRVVLFGIRPQYRGQSNATFKMVFNAIHM